KMDARNASSVRARDASFWSRAPAWMVRSRRRPGPARSTPLDVLVRPGVEVVVPRGMGASGHRQAGRVALATNEHPGARASEPDGRFRERYFAARPGLDVATRGPRARTDATRPRRFANRLGVRL